ncbi:hypothetical protein AG1IA_03674 [Rhizoctonia solani AG-1 IA]|uniref:Uncharacterized protein n=1 Tax=Thanatephorus cucumeris (strain AG1-IA) TaxID=983506 RepID=L8X114_THACA|nr:hypothetical protein AG1IA_03674 [Rhizoctonia solani AG-1 IA]
MGRKMGSTEHSNVTISHIDNGQPLNVGGGVLSSGSRGILEVERALINVVKLPIKPTILSRHKVQTDGYVGT